MTKSVLSFSVFTLALVLPAIAAAEPQGEGSANCPPGSWFCEEAPQPAQGQSTGQPTQPLQPLPSTSASGSGQSASPPPPPPPIVVYQPAPPPPVVVVKPDTPPTYPYRPREPKPSQEWGLNLHLQGFMIGKGRDGNASMGAIGGGVRFRPVPQVALEADLDFAGGRDYQGMKRNETSFQMNTLIFLNPRSKVQFYLLAGLGVSGARVVDDRAGYDMPETHYFYFGGQGGAGLEFRLARHFALNVDVRGFLRARVDDKAQYTSEFRDADGRSTNTSGGGLLNGGMTFYF